MRLWLGLVILGLGACGAPFEKEEQPAFVDMAGKVTRWVSALDAVERDATWTVDVSDPSAMLCNGTESSSFIGIRIPLVPGEELVAWHVDWQSTDPVVSGAAFLHRVDPPGTVVSSVDSDEPYFMYTHDRNGDSTALRRSITSTEADGIADDDSWYRIRVAPSRVGAMPGGLRVWRVGITVRQMFTAE